MVDKYLRSVCKSARKRFAEIRSLMQEHHGRGLMAVHQNGGFRVAVVPQTLKMEQGLLVIPCSVHLSCLKRDVGVRANDLELIVGPLKLDAVFTHHAFFPEESDHRRIHFHIGDPAFLTWYDRFGSRRLYEEAPRIAERLGHKFCDKDLAPYHKEYKQVIAEQARDCANRACTAAEQLKTGAPKRVEKEDLLRELERSHRYLNELLTAAETAGLDPAGLDGHRKYYEERLAAYT